MWPTPNRREQAQKTTSTSSKKHHQRINRRNNNNISNNNNIFSNNNNLNIKLVTLFIHRDTVTPVLSNHPSSSTERTCLHSITQIIHQLTVVPELRLKEAAAEEFQTTAVYQWLSKSKTANRTRNSVTKAAFYLVQEKIHRLVQVKLTEAAQTKSLILRVLPLLTSTRLTQTTRPIAIRILILLETQPVDIPLLSLLPQPQPL